MIVDEGAHHLSPGREENQRDQGEGDPEREYDLADHRRPRRVDVQVEDGERRDHRHRAPIALPAASVHGGGSLFIVGLGILATTSARSLG